MIFLILAVLLTIHCVWFVRARIASQAPADTAPGSVAMPEARADDQIGTAWTALDDHQLNRLLDGPSS
jgi:hypothetical protein